MLSINTNILALNAQNNLLNNQPALSTSMQQLSSGLRINTAADDPSGLTIATRMTSQINGFNQAISNANNAVSLLQTANGSLTTITNNLQTLRDLAIEAGNSTNSSQDLAQINTQAQQLISEIDQIATTTQYNGINLLDGSFQNQQFQVGAFAGQTLTISSISSARTAALTGGTSSYSSNLTGGVVTGALTNNAISLNGMAIASSVAGTGADQYADSAWAIANAMNATTGTNVTATANKATNATSAVAVAVGTGAIDMNAGFSINGINITPVGLATASNAAGEAAGLAEAINAASATTGVTAVANGTAGVGFVVLSDTNGGNIEIASSSAATATLSAGAIMAADLGMPLASLTTRGTVTLASNSSNGILIGGASAAAGIALAGFVNAGLTAAVVSVSGAVSSITLTSLTAAQSAMTTIDSALASVNNSQASLGAYQNRITSAVSALQNAAQNLTSAKSGVMDANYAAATTNMTQAMITQQAGISVLAQANTLPQQILALLPKS